MTKNNFSRGICVWEIKFSGIYKVKEDCLRMKIFKTETCFIEKLDMCDLRQKDLKKLHNKIMGIETEDFKNKRGYAAAQRLFGGNGSRKNSARDEVIFF